MPQVRQLEAEQAALDGRRAGSGRCAEPSRGPAGRAVRLELCLFSPRLIARFHLVGLQRL
jgi:hypothetical protein